MKPIVIRLGALAAATVLGLITIAQARYGKHDNAASGPPAPQSVEHSPGLESRSASTHDAPRQAIDATDVDATDFDAVDTEAVAAGSGEANPPAFGEPPFSEPAVVEPEVVEPASYRANDVESGPDPRNEVPAAEKHSELQAAYEGGSAGVSEDRYQDLPASSEPFDSAAPLDETSAPETRPAGTVPETDQLQPMARETELQPLAPIQQSARDSAGFESGSYRDPTALSSEPETLVETTAPIDARPLATGSELDASEGTGVPGDRQLEGAQTPSLTLQKFTPLEIQVGKECLFQLKVRNTGAVIARSVILRDEVPQKTRLVLTKPQARQDGEGRVAWELSTLAPGEEAVFEMHLLPLAEGEVGSVATLAFEAQASARTLATKPQLALRLDGPQQVMIHDEVRIGIDISNPGTGAAEQVVLLEDVPSGLSHPAGQRLEFEVGRLAPGESRRLELVLTAEQAGRITNVLTARADANVVVEESLDVEVIAPRLEVAIDGPKRRYLERPAVYSLALNNPGTAPAKDVELAAYLPPGLKFVEASNHGHYDPSTHTVVWGLEELPPQVQGKVELVALPVEPGDHKLRVEGRGAQGLASESEQIVTVEGLAAIMFEVTDLEDPIEMGGETTYEIRVVNQGSKAATNVQVLATLPPEMKALSATGPVQHTIDAERVAFAPLRRLAPKADTTYRVTVQGLAPGDLRLNVRVATDDIEQPVTKEESTRVYADQ
jgi:uncharacterized repeat protein (TIGR01451 family)